MTREDRPLLLGARHAVRMVQRRLNLDLEFDSDDDLSLLRGALIAARATELAEMHRRGFRQSYGKNADSALASMSDEVAHHARRIELLDRLIAALADG